MDLVNNSLIQFLPILTAIAALLLSQAIKWCHLIYKKQTVTWKVLFYSGGMPSSHAAMVSALTLSIGLSQGWSSQLFFVCLIFSLVVVYDAAGVRYCVGQHATVLQPIVDDHLKDKTVALSRVNGHTPKEVVVGIILGLLLAFLSFKFATMF